ncbi:hypothetical protein [Nocardia aurantiaca]|uniref:hypothetical protein n=1 Tax=Nocardia aurantiaca TaxID=2675850 RepID=UPI0018AA2138|nr:hypothetical protein [Nocardia aurantiaca]
MIKHPGSTLVGMTYIFDEPSVGLYPRDLGRLSRMLEALRHNGNTVLVVERDPDVIQIADHIVDIGPPPAHTAARSSSPVVSPN